MEKLDFISDSLAEINVWVLPDVRYSSILFLNDISRSETFRVIIVLTELFLIAYKMADVKDGG